MTLLKDLNSGERVDPELVRELCQVTDLALSATKQTAHSIGCVIAAMVAVERHLWLNLSALKKKGLSAGCPSLAIWPIH